MRPSQIGQGIDTLLQCTPKADTRASYTTNMVGAQDILRHRESMLISKGQEEFAGREKTAVNRAEYIFIS